MDVTSHGETVNGVDNVLGIFIASTHPIWLLALKIIIKSSSLNSSSLFGGLMFMHVGLGCFLTLSSFQKNQIRSFLRLQISLPPLLPLNASLSTSFLLNMAILRDNSVEIDVDGQSLEEYNDDIGVQGGRKICKICKAPLGS